MNQEKLNIIYGKSRLVCAILSMLTALSYIVAVYHLYLTGGDTPYTAERVGAYLLVLLPLSVLTVVSVVFSGVLSVKLNPPSQKLRAIILPKVAMQKLYRRYRISAINRRGKGSGDKCLIATPEEYDSIAVNHRTRLITNVVFTAAVAVIIAVALFPILDMSAYTVDDLNGSVIRAFLWSLAPTAAIIGGVFTVTSIFDKSFLREIDQLKALIASTTPSDVPLSRSYEKEKKLFHRITGFVLMGVAVAFIAVGVANGDLVSVIKKAVAICTECIGLG